MKKETQIIHKGRSPEKHSGTVNVPIYSSSTVIFPTLSAYNKAQEGELFYESFFDNYNTDPSYGITGNQTNFALQEVIQNLEGGDACFLTPSGLSAITTAMLSFLKSGDHVLMVDSVYWPSRRFCNQTLKSMGIETTYYNPHIGGDIKDLVKDNTAIIFLEAPGSLTFEMQDIEPIVKVAKEKNIITIIDNSWASPLYFSPLEWGVDISIQAVTKYISGHSDILLGGIICKEKHANNLRKTYKNLGISVSAHDCYLALRGVRTMHARMKMQQESTNKIIAYLAKQPKVKEILYPAYEGSKDYALYKKYFKGAASLFSVILDKKYSEAELEKMIGEYKYFGIGASWGGYESLVKDFDLTQLRTATPNQKSGTCVRYYIGLENPDELIEDLDRGFKVI
jgi:cystathionine beta-lyase